MLKGIKTSTFEASIKALVEKDLVHKIEPEKNSSPYIAGPAPV